MIYEITNPSDAYTIEPAAFREGAIAVLLLGNGSYGMKPVGASKDAPALPIFLLGGAKEWADAEVGGDLEAWLAEPANLRATAAALDTVLIGSPHDQRELRDALAGMPDAEKRVAYLAAWKERRRSSLNNIGARAEQLASALRARAAKREAPAA